MLGTTTNGEHRKRIGVKTMSLFGDGIQLLLSGVLQVFPNRNYELQRRLSGVLPNQQGRQKYVCRCTCIACGTLSVFHYIIMWPSRWRYGEALWRGLLYMTKLEYSIFHYSIMWLSRWRYGEALWRGFLYTTKLESKFILRPTGIPPRISSLKPSKGISTSNTYYIRLGEGLYPA